MPAVLITVGNIQRFTITQNLPSTDIHWQNCRNSTAIRNIIYFVHTSLVCNTRCATETAKCRFGDAT